MGRLKGLVRLFGATGRASRLEFLAVIVVVTMVYLALLVWRDSADFFAPTTVPESIASALVLLVCYWLQISAGVRRMHDMDKSGWILLCVIVPIAGVIVWIWLLARPGTDGDNRYGASPPSGRRQVAGATRGGPVR